MDNSNVNILVVDDEVEIRKIVRLLLQKKGYTVSEAHNGEKAVEIVKESIPDLIIMDIMMPKMSGIEATVEIRKFCHAPILFLTAKSLDSDKIRAYEGGGDDYLVKPFSASELVMRAESLLRRYIVYRGKADEEELVRLSCGVEVNLTQKTVMKNGETVIMRDKESEMFFYLLSRRGDVIDSNEIYEAVWREQALSSSANNVMVNMLGLRKKLEDDPSNPRIIKTVWGRGYQLV